MINRNVIFFLMFFIAVPVNANRMLNRHFLAAKLWSIFVEPEKISNNSYVKNEHKKLFLKTIYQIIIRPHIFGGDCNVYINENYTHHDRYPDLLDKDLFRNGCPPFTDGKTKIKNSGKAASSDLRATRLLENTCQEFLNSSHNKKNYYYALNLYKKANVNPHQKITSSALRSIYKVFYPTLKVAEKEIVFFINNLPNQLETIEQLNLYSLLLCRSNKVMVL